MLRINPRIGFALLTTLFWLAAVAVMLNQWFRRRAESMDLGAAPDLSRSAILAAREVWVGFFIFCMIYVAACVIYVAVTWARRRRRNSLRTQWKIVRPDDAERAWL